MRGPVTSVHNPDYADMNRAMLLARLVESVILIPGFVLIVRWTEDRILLAACVMLVCVFGLEILRDWILQRLAKPNPSARTCPTTSTGTGT